MARARELGLRGAERAAFAPLLAASDFAFELLQRHPDWLADLRARSAPQVVFDPQTPGLGLVRQQHAGALACMAADILQGASAEQVCTRMSVLAAASIETALAVAGSELQARHGQPRHRGEPLGLVVYGMGKLGGGELNFSSDLDLVTAYAEPGETDGPRPLDHQEYFARLTRRCAQLLSESGPEGQAWRIDLRLRPFGQSGQLALSFAAMEQYYQREGRDWERYAWIKARPVAGAIAAGLEFLTALRPFVYRRYLDYAAFEGLREMKALIDAEVRRQGLEDNLKLGPGGIREIEFMVQLEQLIRAGRMPALRTPATLAGLQALAEQRVWEAEKVEQLRTAYLFLRRLENRVQMLGNAQTHSVPASAFERERIAQTLGYPHWTALARELEHHRQLVQAHFAGAVAPTTRPEASSSVETDMQQAHELWQRLQQEQAAPPQAPDGLPPQLWLQLRQFAESQAVRSMSARSRSRLDRVLPLLWSLARTTPDPEATAGRLIEFLQAVARRTAYLALLAEQPQVARMLVRLIGASAWAAQRITSTPILLDELIDPRLLKAEVSRASLMADWQHERSGAAVADDEAEIEALKQFQQSVMLKLAAQFLFAGRPALEVAQALADLADQVIGVVHAQAERSLRAQHGLLPGQRATASGLQGFAILGYGSLGGRELNFASDLDLVFVYDERYSELESSGPRPLDGHRWFVRLAQRILHLLGVATVAGPLYAVDTRLRPDGGKGLLVSAFDRFARYQADDAWTWEHQALVRARCVRGDPQLARRFRTVRQDILGRPRDPAAVHREVAAMRQRMRQELDRSSTTQFDLKQGAGGLVDLEFALQAQVLASPATLRPWPGSTTALLRRLSARLGGPRGVLESAHRRWLQLGLAATLSGRPRVAELDAADAGLRAAVAQALAPWLPPLLLHGAPGPIGQGA